MWLNVIWVKLNSKQLLASSALQGLTMWGGCSILQGPLFLTAEMFVPNHVVSFKNN